MYVLYIWYVYIYILIYICVCTRIHAYIISHWSSLIIISMAMFSAKISHDSWIPRWTASHSPSGQSCTCHLQGRSKTPSVFPDGSLNRRPKKLAWTLKKGKIKKFFYPIQSLTTNIHEPWKLKLESFSLSLHRNATATVAASRLQYPILCHCW
jgi:hypothetical protein